MRKLGWVPSGGLQQAGRLYALFSPKGGCGCTTAATNLAIVLHRLTGKKTLLVDLDLDLGETVLLLGAERSEEHTSELQSLAYLVCRLLLEKKKKNLEFRSCETGNYDYEM